MTQTSPSPLADLVSRHAPAAGSPEALALAMIDRLTTLSDQLRQGLSDRLWAEIPALFTETGFSPAAVDGAVIDAPPVIGELVKITQVIASVPEGATGTLRLGTDRIIPNLPAGVTVLQLVTLLGPGDQRRLTITGGTGGAASLILCGMQTAPTGSMAP